MTPIYSRAVNSTNMPYAQQPPITAMGGPTYTYANMSSQAQNAYTLTQIMYPQPSTHSPTLKHART